MFVLNLLFVLCQSYNYENVSSWRGECQSTTKQQSPILIDTNDVTSTKSFFDVYLSSKFVYSPTTLMIMEAHEGEAASLDTRIDIKYNAPIGTIKWTDDNDDTGAYSFTQVDIHYGRSEHIVDNWPSDGAYHLVFKGGGNGSTEYVVVEVPFKFSSLGTSYNSNISVYDFCPDNTSISPDRCGVNRRNNYLKSGGANVAPYVPSRSDFFKLLTGKDFRIDDFVSYSGSNTTPGCSPNVRWLVYKNKPISIAEIPGFRSIQATFKNRNYKLGSSARDTQPILKSTKVVEARGRSPTYIGFLHAMLNPKAVIEV